MEYNKIYYYYFLGEGEHVVTNLDVVTFGETMACLKPQGTASLENSPWLLQTYGGAESNVAIGLSRLGVKAGWFSRLGKDPFGNSILKNIRGEGVDVSRVQQVDTAPTGMMMRELVYGKVQVHYYRKHSAASTMKPSDLDEAYIASAKILHITGITAALSNSSRETLLESIRIARRNGVKVSFDPNLRLKLWSAEEAKHVIMDIAREVDYFLPGFDEMMLLLGKTNLMDILAELKHLDAVIVMKSVDDATCLIEQGNVTMVPFVPAAHVVDTIGAGDGFCAGFLAGVSKGYTLDKAVHLGNLVGSFVVQAHGDWEALPTWETVERVLQHKYEIER